MSPNKVYIALGIILGNSEVLAKEVIDAIATLPKTTLLRCSSYYRTPPLGPQDQPDYLNVVILIETSLSALELLDALQSLETQFGRVRKDERWGPRTLDLDILLYANQTIQSDRLTIPHYDLQNRSFVLIPLYEITPTLILPNGIAIEQLVLNLPKDQQIHYWHSK